MSGCTQQLPYDSSFNSAPESEQQMFLEELNHYLQSQSNNLIDAAIEAGQSSLDIRIECRYLSTMTQIKEKLIPDYFYEIKGTIENRDYSLENFHLSSEQQLNPNHLLIRLKFKP